MLKRYFALVLVFTLLFSWSSLAFAKENMSVSEVTVEKLLEISKTPAEDNVSRGAFAAMLVYAAGISESAIDNESDLPEDFNSDIWYAKSVKALWDRNIMRGSSGKVNPDEGITGIEAMVTIARVLGVSERFASSKEIKNLPQDHWGYPTYAWLSEEGLLLEDIDPLKDLNAKMAAELLVKVFGTDQQVKAIVEESTEKNKEIKAFRASGHMAIEINMVDEKDEVIPMKTNASFNSEFSRSAIHQTVETLIPIVNESIKIEQYMDKEYIYTLIPGEDKEDKWIKMKNFVPAIFEEDFIAQQQGWSKELEELVHYRLLGTEKIDGEDCYKIAMYTRLDDINQLLDKMGTMGIQEKEALKAANDVLQSISMKGLMYIGVEDGLVKKATTNAIISMDLEKQKDSPAAIKSMLMDMEYNYKDYNEDFSIEIPEEAKNADEIDLGNIPSPDNK